MAWRRITPLRASHWPLKFVRRAVGWLASPMRRLSFIELALLVDIEIARVLALAGAGRDRERCGPGFDARLAQRR